MIKHTRSVRGRHDAGFTLIELLVTLAIAGVAATFVLPNISQTRQNLRLQAFATDLVSDLKPARAQALQSNRETLMILDDRNRTYVTSSMVKKKPIPTDFNVTYETQAAELTGTEGAGFRFRPDGTASGGRIVLRSQTGSVTVAIDWLTGTITSTSR